MVGPLSGVSVLDHSTVGPASRCTALLADLGASVVKVGPVGGDRWEAPWYAYGAGRETVRARFDLKHEGARDAYLALAGTSDVVVESFRPGVADRLGIGFEPTRERNLAVVYCATTGYGAMGPYKDRAGHDLNYLAVGGFLATQGTRADGGPALPGATVADSAGGGMQAAIAILAALLRARATGEGTFLDVSTTDGVLSLTSLNVEQYLATAEEPGPGSTLLTGKYACYDVYEARDGRWLAVGAIEPRFFANLCAALGVPELAEHQMDDARQDELRAALQLAFAKRDRDDWVAELADTDTCVSPVLSIAEVSADEHLRARGLFATVRGSRGRVEQVAPTVAGAERAREYQEGGEVRTAELLARAGVAKDHIDGLLKEGAIE
jgi:alpha-methylacyl-CoA racemase